MQCSAWAVTGTLTSQLHHSGTSPRPSIQPCQATAHDKIMVASCNRRAGAPCSPQALALWKGMRRNIALTNKGILLAVTPCSDYGQQAVYSFSVPNRCTGYTGHTAAQGGSGNSTSASVGGQKRKLRNWARRLFL